MKVLVSGGSGFLGSHLVKYYLDKGDEVWSLARNEFRQWQLKQRNPKVNIILGDVQKFDDDSMKPDIIIHTAAMKHVSFCEENKAEAERINVWGTNNMIDYAYNCGAQFVLISSDKAIEPTTFYGKTKFRAERLAKCNDVKIARFGNFFGSTGSVLQIWLEKLIQGEKKIQIHDKDCRRYFVEVNDACKRIDQFLQTDSKIMIYAGAIGWMDDLAKAVFGDTVEIEYTQLLKGEKLIEKMDIDLDESQFERYTVEELRTLFKAWALDEIGIDIDKL